jgi:hypothetical protein
MSAPRFSKQTRPGYCTRRALAFHRNPVLVGSFEPRGFPFLGRFSFSTRSPKGPTGRFLLHSPCHPVPFQRKAERIAHVREASCIVQPRVASEGIAKSHKCGVLSLENPRLPLRFAGKNEPIEQNNGQRHPPRPLPHHSPAPSTTSPRARAWCAPVVNHRITCGDLRGCSPSPYTTVVRIIAIM